MRPTNDSLPVPTRGAGRLFHDDGQACVARMTFMNNPHSCDILFISL